MLRKKADNNTLVDRSFSLAYPLRTLSCAVEQSPSIIIITDTEGCIEYINPRFTAVTGYLPEEIIGKNPRVLKSDHASLKTYQQLWQTITAGNVWRGELLNKKKNGDLYWVAASISPVHNGRGEITHFVGIQEEITERKQIEQENARLFQAVSQQRKQLDIQAKKLRRLAQKVLQAHEEERYRVSRDLHDVTSQKLTLLKINLESLRSELAFLCKPQPQLTLLEEMLEESMTLCQDTMRQVRALAHQLRPSILEDMGLNQALKSLCQEFSRNSSLMVVYSGVEIEHLPHTAVTSLYRIVQEGLTNVFKHAQARQACVTLKKSNEGVYLQIQDDGRGFQQGEIQHQAQGIGLLGMVERLESLGGTLTVNTESNSGTELVAFIPHQA